MEDDIVLRLRSNLVSQKYQLEAANEIEMLRRELLALRESVDIPNRLLEIHSSLMKEEDIEDCYDLSVIAEAAHEIERLREIITRMEVRRG